MNQQSFIINKGALFSPCRKYRYKLWRTWGWGHKVAFIGLNPSIADEEINDNTVTRCINYAISWGFDGLIMLNAFGYRATKPQDLKKAKDPIGPDNDRILIESCRQASLIVAAWGSHGGYMKRHDKLLKILPELHFLKLTQRGYPNHPLYLKADLKPIPWRK